MGTPNDIGQSQLYNGLGQANEYVLIPGVWVLPLAEDPPTNPTTLATYSPVVIGRLHAPYRIRKYNFNEHKQNNPPIVPSPIDQGSFVFLGGSIQFSTQLNNTGITYDWTVSTGYLYIENCVSRLQDGFVLGTVTPFSNQSDQAGVANYAGNQPPTIGAISQAGPNAVAGYNLGNIISPSSTPGATTYGATSSGATTYGNVPQSGQNNSTVSSVTSMSYSWSYSLGAFFPGNFFNDALANGGGV